MVDIGCAMYRPLPGVKAEKAEIHADFLPKVFANVIQRLVPEPELAVAQVAHEPERSPVLLETFPQRAVLAKVMQDGTVREELVNLKAGPVFPRSWVPNLSYHVVYHLNPRLGTEGEPPFRDPGTLCTEVAVEPLFRVTEFPGGTVSVLRIGRLKWRGIG